jgi:superfamily II DNA or RNA helicase
MPTIKRPSWQTPPRAWQREALPLALDAIRRDVRGVVRAVMGAGKSVLIAEICASIGLAADEHIVVTTPTVALVDQLSATLAARGLNVGRYYTHAKEIRPVIVACLPSVAQLAADLDGRCVLWLADEAHRTEADALKVALEELKPYRRLGVTATPWRGQEAERLSEYDTVIYDYGPGEAVRDGVVVPPRIIPYLGGVKGNDLDEVCAQWVEADTGRGIVNAKNIEDAEGFSALLNARGTASAVVHSHMPRTTQAARLDALKAGELHCVVHVALLQEGVDLPWLDYLVMRRRVGSRVRFAQEVGRVLRSAPSKTEARVYDPHDLWEILRLDYDACLGAAPVVAPPDPRDALADELAALLAMLPPADVAPAPDLKAKIQRRTRAYLRSLALAWELAGALKRRDCDLWGVRPVSAKQLKVIAFIGRGMLRKTLIPMNHRKALQAVIEDAKRLTTAEASDLISILDAARQKAPWPATTIFDESA